MTEKHSRWTDDNLAEPCREPAPLPRMRDLAMEALILVALLLMGFAVVSVVEMWRP